MQPNEEMLPYDMSELQQLISIYQYNLSIMRQSVDELNAVLIMMVINEGGELRIPQSLIESAIDDTQQYQLILHYDEEKDERVIRIEGVINGGEVSEVSDGDVSGNGRNERTAGDSG